MYHLIEDNETNDFAIASRPVVLDEEACRGCRVLIVSSSSIADYPRVVLVATRG